MGLDPSIGRGGRRRRCALRDGPQNRLAFGLAGLGLRRRSLHLGVSRGRPWCPPSLLRQSSAFEKERPLRGPCTYLAYGRSTCAELASRVDTKVSYDDTDEWEESRWRGAVLGPAAPGTLGDAEAMAGTRLPNAFLGSTRVPACLQTAVSLATGFE